MSHPQLGSRALQLSAMLRVATPGDVRLGFGKSLCRMSQAIQLDLRTRVAKDDSNISRPIAAYCTNPANCEYQLKSFTPRVDIRGPYNRIKVLGGRKKTP